MVLANIAILLHVATGLAQKPDRSAIDGLAQAGADEAISGEDRIFGDIRVALHSLLILICRGRVAVRPIAARVRDFRRRCGWVRWGGLPKLFFAALLADAKPLCARR